LNRRGMSNEQGVVRTKMNLRFQPFLGVVFDQTRQLSCRQNTNTVL
jgi:hypothetical protein